MEADLIYNSWYPHEQQQTSQNQYTHNYSLEIKEKTGILQLYSMGD